LSGSAGVVWELPQDYSVALNAAYTQRAPTYVELLADGPHLATAAYERGDAGLGLEKSLGLDLTLRKSSGWITGSAGGFYNRFNDFIALIPTGTDFDFEGEALPVQQYQNAGVDFFGGEAEVTFHLLAPQEAAENLPGPRKQPSGKSPTAAQAAGARQKLDLQLSADYVFTRDRTNGGPLPRIPPFRTGASLIYEWDRLSARLEGQYVAAQHRTADFELPTDAWFLLNAGVGWRVLDGPVNLELFVRGTNLLNAEARQHASFLKDIAPMEGRAVLAGLSVSF
jgi:iron complex outermembrane receptor protein